MKGVTRQVQDKLPDNPTSSLRITWIGYFRWFASILYLLKNKRSGGLDTPYQSALIFRAAKINNYFIPRKFF